MSDFSKKRLMIACGGTGGHLFPGIAVAEAWTREGGEVVLLISEKQIDALASEGYGHLRFEKMPSVAMPRVSSPKMILFLVRLVGAFFACRRLFASVGAEAVLGMGGFTSAAPLMAGRSLGLPTFIHESNAIPGRANRFNAKFAKTILVGFDRCAGAFPDGKPVKVVGTPLRPSLKTRPSREDALLSFGLDPSRRTLMVMGGSQGARRLNELVAAGLPEFGRAGVQVLHISGPLDYETIRPAYEEHPEAGALLDFCRNIENAYAACDLAICRSGASTLSELAFFEIPSVLIPYPFAAEDHQTLNAEIFSVPGAAELWVQADLNERNFAGRIIELIQDGERLGRMSREMASLAIPDASDQVCLAIGETLT